MFLFRRHIASAEGRLGRRTVQRTYPALRPASGSDSRPTTAAVHQKTWLQLRPERAHIGKQSFLRLFEEEPLIKKTFDLAQYWGDDLLNNAIFQIQADRFGKTIEYMVDNIEDLHTDGAKYSFGVGVYHAGRAGVSVHFFDALVKPLLLVWQSELKGDFTPAVKDEWRTLFLYMVQKMKEGFTSATKDNDVDNQT